MNSLFGVSSAVQKRRRVKGGGRRECGLCVRSGVIGVLDARCFVLRDC